MPKLEVCEVNVINDDVVCSLVDLLDRPGIPQVGVGAQGSGPSCFTSPGGPPNDQGLWPVSFGELLCHPQPHLLGYPEKVCEGGGILLLGSSEMLLSKVLQLFIVEDKVLWVCALDSAKEILPTACFKSISIPLLYGLFRTCAKSVIRKSDGKVYLLS